MTVDPADAAGQSSMRGRTYYFCGRGCLERFTADPQAFLSARPSELPHAPAGTAEYTCPMHPEIVRDGPGACPICGMALEPRTSRSRTGPNPELVDMTRRFWIGAAARGARSSCWRWATWSLGHGPRRAHRRARRPTGSSSRSRRRSSSGAAGRSSSAAGRRSSTAARTCSR